MPSEHTPLLGGFPGYDRDGGRNHGHRQAEREWRTDPHAQFCLLVGVPPSSPPGAASDGNIHPANVKPIPRKALYQRATRQLSTQRMTYWFTATLSNTLLLSQVILGAALTALGASASSHVLITLFGAANTIIAGLCAYLKSRGQPMRARMYLDDLERVVGEIENSEVMWLGISHGAHGYDDIDTEEHQVTVRSEVARLTRLYDRAVNLNTANNPDMYAAGQQEAQAGASRSKPPPAGQTAAAPAPAPSAAATPGSAADAPAPPASLDTEDDSPATAAAPPKKEEPKKEEPKKEEAPKAEPAKEVAKVDEPKKDAAPVEPAKKADTPEEKKEEPAKEEAPKEPAPAETTTPAPVAAESSGSFKAESFNASSTDVTQVPAEDPDASPASEAFLPLKKKGKKKSGLVNGEN